MNTQPRLRWSGFRWILDGDTRITVDGRSFVVPDGFLFDLASIPRLFRFFIDRTELGVAAPLLHDWIYQNRGTVTGLRRADADRLFLLLMEDDGVPWLRRRLAWLAVRMFGWVPWPPGPGGARNVALRAFHTAWQAGLAAILVDGWAVPAVAAGLSAAKTVLVPWVKDSLY